MSANATLWEYTCTEITHDEFLKVSWATLLELLLI